LCTNFSFASSRAQISIPISPSDTLINHSC
jgi:hypothetical protein